MKNTAASIHRIVSAFKLDEKGTLFFKNNIIHFIDSQNTNACVELISNLLYKHFYSGIGDSTEIKSDLSDQQNQFYEQLIDAYNPSPGFNKGWVLLEKEINGVANLQKEESIIKCAPGQFVYEYDEIDKFFKHSYFISVLTPPILNDKKNYFYYVSGSTPDFGNEVPVVRFYFNIMPQGVPQLIKYLTNYFNLFCIPFNFKCCQNIGDYNRTDSAVLYISYYHFAISIQLLEKIILKIKPYLKTEIPLFSLHITDGFSFAENPFGNLSFGQSRCNTIAAGIYDCVLRKSALDVWSEYILEKIVASGYSLEKMHLNPGSVYQYNFSLVNF